MGYRTTGDVLKDPNGHWVTADGQVLGGVHDPAKCEGENCVIHNPSDHSLRYARTHWRRDRGIMERICKHGVGHPDPDSPWPIGSHQWVHGCDGCCR